MSHRAGHAPIVVGVDAQGRARDALIWAAAEAASQGCPLRVVHAFHQPVLIDPYGVSPSGETGFSEVREAAKAVVQDAMATAKAIGSDLQVSGVLSLGTAGRTLLREASQARLLVVGTSERSGRRSLFDRSVSVAVCAGVRCPVVVIHPFHARYAGWSPPRVVIGVASSAVRDPAIDLAFHAARQRGIPLTAVHACTSATAARLGGVEGERQPTECAHWRAADGALQGWRERFPDVPVTIKLLHANPARALVSESVGAALLVVSHRGRGRISGKLRASVGQSVARHAQSPVALVRHHRAASDVHAEGGIPNQMVGDGTRQRSAPRRKRRIKRDAEPPQGQL